MKKEIFRFIYENEDGRDDHFNLPIFYNEDTSLELHVRAVGEEYMRINAIGGTLYEAHSTESDKRFTYRAKSTPRKIVYVGTFLRLVPDGTYDRLLVRRTYRAPHPIVLNKKLAEDFIGMIADKNGNSKGYQLVGITLDTDHSDPLPIGSNAPLEEVSQEPEGVPVEKWIRVKDDAGLFSWVPGLMWPNGKVKTIFGDMSNPDSEDDTRDFVDCPFEGYKIVKE